MPEPLVLQNGNVTCKVVGDAVVFQTIASLDATFKGAELDLVAAWLDTAIEAITLAAGGVDDGA